MSDSMSTAEPMQPNGADATSPAPPPVTGPHVTEAQEVQVSDSHPSPNEIADLLEQHRKRVAYGHKTALEGMVATARLLKIVNEHWGYKDKAYVAFALAHTEV